jgi:hypothetical protein
VSANQSKVGWSSPKRLLDALPYALVIIVFLIGHAPFYFEFPLVVFRPDWSGYYSHVETLLSGAIPGDHALKRPLLFPLVTVAVLKLGGDYYTVVVMLGLLRLAAVLVAVHLAGRISRAFQWVTAVGLALYLGHWFTVYGDQLLLPDAMLSALQLVSVAFFATAAAIGRPRDWALGSLFAGIAVLAKASAIYLAILAVIAIAVHFLIRKEFAWKRAGQVMTLALVPFLACYIGIRTYNYFVNGIFAASAMGNYVWVSKTFALWEPSERYDPKLNRIIREGQDVLFGCSMTDKFCRYPGTQEEFIAQAEAASTFEQMSAEPTAGFYGVPTGFLNRYVIIPYKNEFLPGTRRWEAVAKSDDLVDVALETILRHPDIYVKAVLGQAFLLYYSIDTKFEDRPYCKDKDGNILFLAYPYCPNLLNQRITDYAEQWKGWPWFDGNERLVLGPYCCGVDSWIQDNILLLETYGPSALFFTNIYSLYTKYVERPIADYPVVNLMPWILFVSATVALILGWGDRTLTGVGVIVSCAGLGAGMLIALVQNVGTRDSITMMEFRYWSFAIVVYGAWRLVEHGTRLFRAG